MTAPPYRRLRPLGHGGMATVYAAERVLPRGRTLPVACKYMRADLRAHPRLVELFLQEAALGLTLTHEHPGLVAVLDCFEDEDENLCLVMELVDGCTLRDLLHVHGPVPAPVVRAVARQVLAALAYLHARGVVHRDLSPCNVLVSRAGAVKLSDLGLARLLDAGASASGCFRGKTAYASPEQLAGHPVDERSDLFSLGVMLYQMLTGQLPFGSPASAGEMHARILSSPPPALGPEVPADLRALILGVLAPAAEDRAPAPATRALASLDSEPLADAAALAALVAAARERAPERVPSGAPASTSSGALTRSFTGQAETQPRARTRPRRRSRRWLAGAAAALAVPALLVLGYHARGLLAPREVAPPAPGALAGLCAPALVPEPAPDPAPVPPELPAASPDDRGPAPDLAAPAPQHTAHDVQVSGNASEREAAPRTAPAEARPHRSRGKRPPNTARRAPARYFVPRN